MIQAKWEECQIELEKAKNELNETLLELDNRIVTMNKQKSEFDHANYQQKVYKEATIRLEQELEKEKKDRVDKINLWQSERNDLLEQIKGLEFKRLQAEYQLRDQAKDFDKAKNDLICQHRVQTSHSSATHQNEIKSLTRQL